MTVLLSLVAALLWFDYYIAAIFVFIGSYILNELLWTDYIRYNRRIDHCLKCSDASRVAIQLSNNSFQCSEIIDQEDVSVLLEITGKATILGYLFDPYIEIVCEKKPIKQYFERGFEGKRYINISHCIAEKKTIQLRVRHCLLIEKNAHLLINKNPDLTNKRLLILAPHPDDAEIAAFGLCRAYDSTIITVTAGESEPGQSLQQHVGSEATALIGRLRAWDSIAVPQWSGIKPEKCIQLGYSDGTLKQMYKQPDLAIDAINKPLFRQFNRISLASDGDKTADWRRLTQDVSALISKWQPDIIVTPHPAIDAHSDHQLTTEVVKQAVNTLQGLNINFLYYVNHLDNTDRWPFGVHQSLVAPPPGQYELKSFFSFKLSEQEQIDKACSLEMMHDLRKYLTVKKQIRYKLQALFLGRKPHPLGHDPYFRKSVRANELFFIE
ncbi:MAG: PIG-L family deacetylase [Endozoicomonas sp. (ex Botrylloides leachii)]|nr:PIG-L family deacetylase [Endozoicomonas sp. (ex Botrylloides leachii)]